MEIWAMAAVALMGGAPSISTPSIITTTRTPSSILVTMLIDQFPDLLLIKTIQLLQRTRLNR
jgi:hypothetical protein